MTLDNLLKALKSGVSYECVRIEVRRSLLVEDALRAAAKKKFDPSKSLKVYNSVNDFHYNYNHYTGFFYWRVWY